MRRLLILILTVILIILAYFMITDGITIGNYRILSWNDLVDNNANLESKIEYLERLSSVTYPQEQSRLNDSYKQLLIRKEEYADLVLYSSENEIIRANQTQIYETEFLWTKLGNYATKNNGIDMKIDVVRGSNGESNVYNLNFTLVGQYAYISDFISSVENDSKLGFRIDNFLLVPAKLSSSEEDSSNLLQATFTVENVGININSSTRSTSTSSSTNTNTGNNNENDFTNAE